MNNNQFHTDMKKLKDKEFDLLSKFVYEKCGIRLTHNKRTMLESRLQKRLKKLSLENFSDYCNFLFSKEGQEQELVNFINIITTNKTDFFREPDHFDFMVNTALPDLIANRGIGINNPLNVWSAGCSSGEEPYTLSIVLAEFGEKYPGFNFNFMVLGTDISTEVLESAKNAIYSMEKIEPIPMPLKKKYLLRSKDRSKNTVRIGPQIRQYVKFRQLNFLESDFGMRGPMDIIFCRNVIIYFDRETQEKVLNRLCQHLRQGGFLFIGHSETIHGMRLPLDQMAPTVYKKTGF